MSPDSNKLFDSFFENFVYSYATARKLLERAHDNGNLIEGLVLYALLIDATLRNLVAMEDGRLNKDKITSGLRFDDIPLDKHYFEHDDGKWLSESQIYKAANKFRIVSDEELKRLNELYFFRNRVVHRFIISDIAYSDIGPYLDEYEMIFLKLYQKLYNAEQPSALTADEDDTKAKILKKIQRPNQ